ncbi:MAG TPA: glycosyltransferase [Stellaceae bacterium]|nr:glycosyltransferase [Stellaceae bacterium]
MTAMPVPGVTPSSEEAPLLAPAKRQVAALQAGPPILIVAIDTEAEFDWNGPFLRTHTSVRNVRNQAMAQEIFDRFGVRPIYLVDYAVATQPAAYLPLREILAAGRCEIGAHLHPWITPPLSEALSARNSFSQNLPPRLQREKLARLSEAITANFGVRPLAYRAGRLGVGEEIAEILSSLDYEIDMSVLPGIDLRRLHGPDFRRGLDQPYWFGAASQLLEIPATPVFTGLFTDPRLPAELHVRLYGQLWRPSLDKIRLRGLIARLGLLEWTPPTPEGVSIEELRRLTRTLRSRGNRAFVLSYHSSSLLPGSTQYVRSAAELSQFLLTIEQYLEFFIGELGGVAMTPSELRALLLGERQHRTAIRSDDGKPAVLSPDNPIGIGVG